MKKLLSLLLAILMLTTVVLVSCADDDKEKETDDLAFNETEPQDTDAPATDAPETNAPSQGYTFADVDETVYVQNCNKVNIRTSPSAANNDNLAGSLEFGDGRSYKRVKYNEVWSGIDVNGEIFYINSYFLTTSKSQTVFTELAQPMTLYVNNMLEDDVEGSLYIRSYPNTNPSSEYDPDGNVAAVAKHGAALSATAISNDNQCYRVNFTFEENGTTKTVTGYVWKGKYISETVPTGEPHSNTPVTEAPLG